MADPPAENMPRTGAVNLAQLMGLDPTGSDGFRNRFNERNAYNNLFGGQIIAQTLAAADLTVTDRAVHSFHGYFLRAGSADHPVDFAVETTRDGRRFSTRRIVVRQRGAVIFIGECSYRVPMEGFEHQSPAQEQFDPDHATDLRDMADAANGAPLPLSLPLASPNLVEIRAPGKDGFVRHCDRPRRHYWMRAKGVEGVQDQTVQRQILAYLSDFLLSGSALAMHTVPLPGPHLSMASLDHVIWFHRDVRCDDWLMFEADSPNAHGGVNLSRALIYDRQGSLVATVAQEALQLYEGPSQ